MLETHLLDRLRSIEQKHSALTSKLEESIERSRDELQQIFKAIADIEEIATTFNAWKKALVDVTGAKEVIREAIADREIQIIAEIEVIELDRQIADLEYKLRVLLLPQDPHDESNVLLEITAEEGGESSIWAEDLMSIYERYAQSQNWKTKILMEYQHSNSDSTSGILAIKGDRVYRQLKFESGIHEVQRYSILELKNKLNTLTATVNVMPEVDESIFDVDEQDLEFCHYNYGFRGMPRRREAEVILSHKPTGIRIICSTESHQRQNKEIAWTILKAKLYLIELKRQQEYLTHLKKTKIDSNT
jgi:peptide chain release factor 1